MLLDDGVNEYIYGNGRTPLAKINKADGTVTYLHSDTIGSVMASTDSNGALVANTEYSPYGVNLGLTISSFGFAGEWTDPDTKHSYLRARWLDTTTGTFLSRDPLVQSTGDAYGYATGNPISNIDPLGLFSLNPLDHVKSEILDPLENQFNKSMKELGCNVGKFFENAGNVANSTTKFLIDNSGYISAGLGLTGFLIVGTTAAPIVAALALGFGVLSAANEISKCLGPNPCDLLQLSFGILGASTGGAALKLGRATFSELGIFSFMSGAAGIPAAWISSNFSKLSVEEQNKNLDKLKE